MQPNPSRETKASNHPVGARLCSTDECLEVCHTYRMYAENNYQHANVYDAVRFFNMAWLWAVAGADLELAEGLTRVVGNIRRIHADLPNL